MSSAAQVKANQANSQYSTGPRTVEGKQQSAKNSYRHGLNATAESLFAANPQERIEYDQLRHRLHAELLPAGTAEEILFEQYAYSSFQALRAQRIEIEAQDRWLDNPDSQQNFLQMERTIKLGALFERRAAKAFKQLQDLQLHRLAAVELHAELQVAEVPTKISSALPLAKLRTRQMSEEDPLYLGLTIATGLDPQTNRTNPNDPTSIQPIGDNKEREPDSK